MATYLDDLVSYLGATATRFQESDGSYPELARILSLETTAQDKICSFDGLERPDDLVEALYRRVAVNLAKRATPLGLFESVGDQSSYVARLSSIDPEIKRLEAPYIRRIVGLA